MAASYLVKKSDIYYFRHYIPERIQPILGKKEFVRSLKVTNKSLAVKISREIKILFDSIMDRTQQVPSVTWKEIQEAVDRAFDGIYKKYVTNVDTYGPSYKDGYDPLNYIPPEYQEHVLLRDDSLEWGNVGDISTLADKIAQWANLNAVKGTREHHLLCYYTLLGLYQHAHRKEEPGYYEKSILQDINENIKNITVLADQSQNTKKLTDAFEKYIYKSKGAWNEGVCREYVGIFNNLIFPILEIAIRKQYKDILISDLSIDVANFFMDVLVHLPAQFTKRFSGKLTLEEAINYSLALSKGENVNLDPILIKQLREKIKPTTINRKYIANLSQFFGYLEERGDIEKNWLEKRNIKGNKKHVSTYRPFDKNELEKLFSHPIFSKKNIVIKKNEYNNRVPYFKFWLPILGLYSGARENELAQLRVIDIDLTYEIPYINITTSDETDTKNLSSIRKVPIHPMLINLGFARYKIWLEDSNEKYLFPELVGRYDKGSAVSKWFLRFIKANCNLKNNIPNTQLVFHSFRNNFCDEYKQKGIEVHIAGETMGHKTQGMTYGIYGSVLKLKPLHEYMTKFVTYEDVVFPWNDQDYFSLNVFPWEK